MNALAITIFVGVVLVVTFVVFFIALVLRDGGPSERDSLLPLEHDRKTPRDS
jgi:hypothetical protein